MEETESPLPVVIPLAATLTTEPVVNAAPDTFRMLLTVEEASPTIVAISPDVFAGEEEIFKREPPAVPITPTVWVRFNNEPVVIGEEVEILSPEPLVIAFATTATPVVVVAPVVIVVEPV